MNLPVPFQARPDAEPLAFGGAVGEGAPLPLLDLGQLWKVFRRNAWILWICLGVSIAGGLAYALLATKIYASTAVVYIELEGETVLNNKGVRNLDFAGLEILKSFENLLQGVEIASRVIDSEKLAEDPDFAPLSPEKRIQALQNSLVVALQRGTRNILIQVKDSNPGRAARLAEAYVKQFEDLLSEQTIDASRRVQEALVQQKARIEVRLADNERKLEEFRSAHGDMPIDQDGNIVDQKLKELSGMLSYAKNDRLKAQTDLSQMEGIPKDKPEQILDIGEFRNQEHLSQLLTLLAEKRAVFASVRKQYTPKHSLWISLEGEVVELENAVRQSALEAGEKIRNRYQAAVENEQKLAQAVQEQQTEVLKRDSTRKELVKLLGEVEGDRAIFAQLVQRIKETDVAQTPNLSSIRRFQNPRVPEKPVSPNKKLAVVFAGFLGSFLGGAIILGIFLFDRTLRSRAQVEQQLGLPVLAEIPSVKNLSDDDPLGEILNPHSGVSEGFRALRTALSVSSPRSVLIVSTLPNEGKSFCAINLATLQARLGYRTLLLDADFRKPSLAKILKPKTPIPQSDGQNLFFQTAVDNLFLLSCGGFGPNAVNGEHFAAMLWEAYRNFDCVIIDSSPLGVVSDALGFARYVDSVCLVVRAGLTQSSEVKAVCEELRRMRAPLAGCVLNGSTEPTRAGLHFEAYTKGHSAFPALKAAS